MTPHRAIMASDEEGCAAAPNEAEVNHLEQDESVIADLFQGQLTNQYRCHECGKTSSEYKSFTSLNLNIPAMFGTFNLLVVDYNFGVNDSNVRPVEGLAGYKTLQDLKKEIQ